MRDCNDSALLHVQVTSGDVPLHVVEWGTGPAVLLLHGFPDFWYSWRGQAPALAAAGYRCVMPDLRGYNKSGAPRAIGEYRMERLVEDVVAVIRDRCGGHCVVVGHDWGGVIAWHLAIRHPELVDRLFILNAPHPAAFRKALVRSPQLLRSWYVFAVQPPWIPEHLLAARKMAWLKRTLRSAGLSDEDVACYSKAFRNADALRGPLNYYRAAARDLLRPAGSRRSADRHGKRARVAARTVVIWGERDPFLDRSLLDGLEEHVPRLRIERIPDGSHFVHWDQPEAVNAILIEELDPRS